MHRALSESTMTGWGLYPFSKIKAKCDGIPGDVIPSKEGIHFEYPGWRIESGMTNRAP